MPTCIRMRYRWLSEAICRGLLGRHRIWVAACGFLGLQALCQQGGVTPRVEQHGVQLLIHQLHNHLYLRCEPRQHGCERVQGKSS